MDDGARASGLQRYVPAVLRSQGWSAWSFVAALALAGVGVALTFDAWKDIFHIARQDDEQSHVLLVPLVVVWMVWARRVRFLRCPPGGLIVGPIALALGVWATYYGWRAGLQSVWHAGAVLVLVGCLLTALGKYMLFRFLPAFAVLAFMVPVPNAVRQEISMPLQNAGAVATHAVLQALGVDSERAGNMVRIDGMPVAVAEACNGLRMVFALVLVMYAFAFGLPLRNYVRVMILLASPLVALACNIPRLVATSLAYANWPRDRADAFHDLSGWLMLPLTFLVLMGVLRLMRWALLPVTRFNLAYQ